MTHEEFEAWKAEADISASSRSIDWYEWSNEATYQIKSRYAPDDRRQILLDYLWHHRHKRDW
jgi:hypothetical protein